MRTFAGVANLANSKDLQGTTGWGVSVDGYLPILPAKLDDRSNALTINGSYVKGEGIADLYTGLSGAPNSKTTTVLFERPTVRGDWPGFQDTAALLPPPQIHWSFNS